MNIPTSGLKTGVCPKCKSTEIYANKAVVKVASRNAISVSSFTSLFSDDYLCISCGYLEQYVNDVYLKDTKKIDKVKQKWEKVEQ